MACTSDCIQSLVSATEVGALSSLTLEAVAHTNLSHATSPKRHRITAAQRRGAIVAVVTVRRDYRAAFTARHDCRGVAVPRRCARTVSNASRRGDGGAAAASSSWRQTVSSVGGGGSAAAWSQGGLSTAPDSHPAPATTAPHLAAPRPIASRRFYNRPLRVACARGFRSMPVQTQPAASEHLPQP